MKISSILRNLIRKDAPVVDGRATWAADPYAHPVICAMSERERADLPPVHMPAFRRAGRC